MIVTFSSMYLEVYYLMVKINNIHGHLEVSNKYTSHA